MCSFRQLKLRSQPVVTAASTALCARSEVRELNRYVFAALPTAAKHGCRTDYTPISRVTPTTSVATGLASISLTFGDSKRGGTARLQLGAFQTRAVKVD